MREMFLLIMMSIVLTACNTDQMKYGQGGRNACQYVREQMSDQATNIKSVEITKEDSVLSPLIIIFGKTEIYQKRIDLYEGIITNGQLREYIDSMTTVCLDIQRSWIMDKELSDSLKQLPKYQESWRKAYWIEVTMKSNTTKQYRICMDEDGVTPSMTSEEFLKIQDEYMKSLLE